MRRWALVVLSLVAAGPGCGGSDRAPATSATPLTLHEGQLVPGAYEVDAWGPGVVLRIGTGWASHHPEDAFFDVHRLPPGGPVPGTPGWEVALLFVQPQAQGVQELVSEIRRNGFDVESETSSEASRERASTSLRHRAMRISSASRAGIGGFPDRRYRIWALPTDDAFLTVVFDAAAEGSSDEALAEDVIASIRFGSGT